MQAIGHLFKFEFEKPSAEIVAKVNDKIAALKQKIAERQSRVAKLREEYGITDAVLIDLLTQARAAIKRNEPRMNYSFGSVSLANLKQTLEAAQQEEVTIGAGIVNNLLTENDNIEAEKMQVQRLEMIARNLRDLPDPTIRVLTPGTERPMRGHRLSYEEMEYLGF